MNGKKEYLMKFFLPLLLITVFFSQHITDIKHYDSGEVRLVSYYNTQNNKLILTKTSSFYKDGQFREEVSYKNGKMDGRYTQWHNNGIKQKQGMYRKGLKQGRWVTWSSSSGSKRTEASWSDGVLINLKRWDKQGVLVSDESGESLDRLIYTKEEIVETIDYAVSANSVNEATPSDKSRYDSDGDGIPNQIEILQGTDPYSSQSSYKGGWNTNPNKDLLYAPPSPPNCPGDVGCACNRASDCSNANCLSTTKGSFCHPIDGTPFPRFKFEDQFGDIVDFYDFAGQGKPILLEISAEWCEPCNDFSAWIHSNDKSVYKYQWWRPSFTRIRDIILEGKVQYVNVQYECDDKDGFTNSQCLRRWYNKYPTEGVPVLGDFNQDLFEWTKANGMPVFFLIDENMKLINFSNRGMGTSFDILLNRYK